MAITGALGAVLAPGACSGSGAVPDGAAADILLFAGTGTSPNDVAAIKAILGEAGLSYSIADTGRMNALSMDALRAYRLLIMPGGNFVDMGKALSPEASANIHAAVKDGLNYLGVCAGALIAGASPYNGLNLTEGKQFAFYVLSAKGVRKSAVEITTPGHAPIEQYWEDGPQLSGWGEPVAVYPDGIPAAVQGEVGKGWVVLVGTHPEAPESWRRELRFATPANDSHAFARTLIEAALNRTPLPRL